MIIMTKDEILSMKDKDQMNVAVAKAFYDGYSIYQDSYDGYWYIKISDSYPILVPNYCSDISIAMELIKSLRRKGWGFSLKMDNIIWAELYGLGIGYFTCVGETASEAICKVVLLALSAKDMWYEK